jgi:hypothetical protein
VRLDLSTRSWRTEFFNQTLVNEHQNDQRQYRIIPIETASHPSNPFQLSQASLAGMLRYQENVTAVLNIPLSLERPNKTKGATEKVGE